MCCNNTLTFLPFKVIIHNNGSIMCQAILHVVIYKVLRPIDTNRPINGLFSAILRPQGLKYARISAPCRAHLAKNLLVFGCAAVLKQIVSVFVKEKDAGNTAVFPSFLTQTKRKGLFQNRFVPIGRNTNFTIIRKIYSGRCYSFGRLENYSYSRRCLSCIRHHRFHSRRFT